MLVLTRENQIAKSIPHQQDTEALVSSVEVQKNGLIKDIKLELDISHEQSQNLEIKLLTPHNEYISLRPSFSGSGENMKTIIGGEIFNDLIGRKMKGEWKLQTVDRSKKYSGTLHSWSLVFNYQPLESNKSEVSLNVQDKEGLVSEQYFQHKGSIEDMALELEVDHNFIGELKIDLISPSGTSVTVHNREGGGQKNLKKTYGMDLLGKMKGENCQGKWTLQLLNFATAEKGVLKRWTIQLKYKA